MLNEKCQQYGKQGSAIRELFEYGKQRKAIVGEDNVYDFSIGNPSVPAPKEVKEILVKILNNHDSTITHGYTSAIGDLNARTAIANDLSKRFNAEVDPTLIYLCCGAAAGLTICFKNIISSPKDEIIVFAPFFPEYETFVNNANGKLVVCPSDEKMIIDFNALESLINENTKAVVIDSPNNPTGVVYKEEVIIKLSSLLDKKQKEFNHDIYLISDEPYRELIYIDAKYPFVTNYYNNSVVIYSFSKSLSLPGERIGYILVNPKINNAKEFYDGVKGAGRLLGFVNAPSLFQYAIPEIIGYLSDIKIYERNRDLLYKELIKLGYEVIHPDGAFYMFVKALEDDAYRFSQKAKEYDLLLVPSDSFGIKGYVRIAYCVSEKTILNSFEAFKKLKESYWGK